MILTKDFNLVQKTAWVFPTGDATVCTVQVNQKTAAWTTAVITIKVGNRPGGPFYALPTSITISAEGITVPFDVSGYGYVALDVTTAETSADTDEVSATAVLK